MAKAISKATTRRPTEHRRKRTTAHSGQHGYKASDPMPTHDELRREVALSDRKHRSITDWYRDFERAHAAYQGITDTEGTGKIRWERLLDQCARIARRIVNARADNVGEMLLKIRVAVWDIGDIKYQRLEDLDRWRPTRFSPGAEHDALASLRDDLRRVQLGPISASHVHGIGRRRAPIAPWQPARGSVGRAEPSRSALRAPPRS